MSLFASRSVVQIQPTKVKLESDSCFGACVWSISWWSHLGSEQTGVQIPSGPNQHLCWQLQRQGQRLCGHWAWDARAWVVLVSQHPSKLARQPGGLRLLLSVLHLLCKQTGIFSSECCSCSFDSTFKKVIFFVFALFSFFSLFCLWSNYTLGKVMD